MSGGMTAEAAEALRKPFPKASIGKLPKGGIFLDFVGHAAVTERLLAVDPGWSWEPFAVTTDGLPALDRANNLWIRLTICGVTRIGVGDGKAAKEMIGDAIRNAAMRFGVAIDLWAKEDLLAFDQAAAPATRTHKPDPLPPTSPTPSVRPPGAECITRGQITKIAVQMKELGLTDRDTALLTVADITGRNVSSRNELTKHEANKVITRLGHLLGELPEPTEENA